MTLPDQVARVLTDVAAVPRLLVATDFDGVLAPLVLDPSSSRPLPGTIDSLTGLAGQPDTYAAVVSGRDLATLGELTGIARDAAITLIGSHGAESSAGGGDSALSEQDRQTLQRLCEELEEVVTSADAHDGSAPRLELKPAAVGLHTRGMEEEAARAAEDAALEVAARHTGVSVLHGKHIVEVSVHDADKGTALAALREQVGADALVYFGDDVTDENVFTRLDDPDVGVKVGDGETAARWRVDEPQDVADALALLLDRRRAR